MCYDSFYYLAYFNPFHSIQPSKPFFDLIVFALTNSDLVNFDVLMQILPEKYCYFRKVDQDSTHATDCVICMTAIDLTQNSNDCMVFNGK